MKNRSLRDEDYILKRRFRVKKRFDKLMSEGVRPTRAHVLLADKEKVCVITIINDLKYFKKYEEQPK